MNNQVQVIEKNTGEVLYQCSFEDREKAFSMASEYEQMGLDIDIKTPSLPQSLLQGLGADQEMIDNLNQEMQDEIASHESDTCCFKN